MERAIGIFALLLAFPTSAISGEESQPRTAKSTTARTNSGSMSGARSESQAEKRTPDRVLGDREIARVLAAVRDPSETNLFEFLKRSDGGPGTLVEAMYAPSFRLQFAAADSILKILKRSPSAQFPREMRVIEVLSRAIHPETIPTVILITSSGQRPAELERVMRQMGYETTICTTGKDAFRYAAASASVAFVVAEPVFIDYDLRYTLVNFNADSRTAGIPFFVFTDSDLIYEPIRNFWNHSNGPNVTYLPMEPQLEFPKRMIPVHLNSLRWRLNYLAEEYPKVRLIPRVMNLEGWNTVLSGEFGPSTEYPSKSNPLIATERVLQQRAALDWLLRIVRGEFPRLKILPHSEAEETLRDLLGDTEVGPLAAEILGYLPLARNQEALAKAVLSPDGILQVGPQKPPATKLAACEALARNVDRGGLAIDNATIMMLYYLSKNAQDPDLRSSLAKLMEAFLRTDL